MVELKDENVEEKLRNLNVSKNDYSEKKQEIIPEDKDTGVLLDELVRIGRIVEVRHLYGLDWGLTSLNQGELLDSQKALPVDTDEITKLYFLSIETLSRAIVSINKVPIYEVFYVSKNTPNFDNVVVNKVREYLRKLHQSVTDELFAAYSEISGKVSKKLENLKKK